MHLIMYFFFLIPDQVGWSGPPEDTYLTPLQMIISLWKILLQHLEAHITSQE